MKIRTAVIHLLGALALLSAAPLAVGQMSVFDFPERASALREHLLERDYLERFEGAPDYRITIRNIIFDDLDSDGVLEAVMHYKPHYLQSPTIVFYRFPKNSDVTRFTEALAPGPLVPRGNYYLDSHTLNGLGVDFTFGNPDQGPEPPSKEVIHATLESFDHLVAYPAFMHVDRRISNGVPSFIDLTHVEMDPAWNNCERFEFHELDEIAVGGIDGIKYLAARVGGEIYLYHLRAFNDDGLLDKEIRVIPTPADLVSMASGATLSYTDETGRTQPFDSPGERL